MERLVRLAAAGICAALLIVGRQAAEATPFSDVPANHWAYQYIQSLAADGLVDGYPDGKFKGDRPLTRYEMAVIVARVIAKLQENDAARPSREDLDKVQKLVDALKDELDALGVRVTRVEDALGSLDRRTKFAQSLSLHGDFLPNVTFRQRVVIPRTITNTTGVAQRTYYGVTVPAGGSGTSAVAAVDPFLTAFLTTDDTNNPITQATSGIQIRQDSRFSLAYAIDDNLRVSLPVHILSFAYGGEFSQQTKFDVEPSVNLNIAKAGALSNLDFTFGLIENMSSSRLGLAFKAPQGYDGQNPYALPYQPYQKGVAVKGTVGEGAFGLTDVEASFTRVDNTLFNTQPGVTDPNVAPFDANNYFFPVVAPQAGFAQNGAAGNPRTDTFSAGNGVLQQVFLTQKAQNGSVYISALDGTTFGNAGAGAPGFTYNDAYNAVVFATPLPSGSTVAITYRGLGLTNDTSVQRYMVHARANQTFKGVAGLQIGLTFNRIFDFDDTQTSGSGPTALTQSLAAPVQGYGDVSDTVLGLDFEAPLPFDIFGRDSRPVIFGELANSTFTPDTRTLAAQGDTAALFGVRLKAGQAVLSAQYQSVGVNFFDGAPFRYYGNAPSVFANYSNGYFPDFFGFANNLGINRQFDAQFTRLGLSSPGAQGNPNLTFVYPMWNTLRASGPQYFSAFAPNSRGETVSLDTPVRVGDFNFAVRASYQHLEEISPNANNVNFFGPEYPSNRRALDDAYTVGTSFGLPVFRRRAATNLSATYETLRRLDRTARQYYPVDPATQAFDAAAVAAANAAFPRGGTYGAGSGVSFYPNYVNVRKIGITASAALPLTNDLTLGGSYSTQRYGGAYGTTVGQNISERKDYYTGSLTYAIPRTNSSLTFLARRYTYTDEVIPNTNLGENRQDLNFTVRF